MVVRGPKLIVGSNEIVETARSYRKVAAWSLCSICKITQIPAATHRDRNLTMWPPYNRSTFSDKAAHPRSLARIFAICTFTHNIYTMIKSQTLFLTCSPTILPCMLVGTIQYNAIKYQKTCAAPLQGHFIWYFSDFFYLVRKRYYFDFLLLSVAEQAGLRFTRSKFQNFDFLPLSITDLGPELQCLLRVKKDLS